MESKYLAQHHREVPDVATELTQFSTYYEIVFKNLNRSVADAVTGQLSDSIVHEVNFEPYPETKEVLETIKQVGLPMAVITDAWPSVRTKFETLGYMRYFDAFVVSAEEKCMKPDMGMFRPALDAIGVTPEQVLFVDDARSIIEAVQANGFRTVLADYEHVHPDWPYRITSIGQVLDFTEKLAW